MHRRSVSLLSLCISFMALIPTTGCSAGQTLRNVRAIPPTTYTSPEYGRCVVAGASVGGLDVTAHGCVRPSASQSATTPTPASPE